MFKLNWIKKSDTEGHLKISKRGKRLEQKVWTRKEKERKKICEEKMNEKQKKNLKRKLT